jgi:hypothetical protein
MNAKVFAGVLMKEIRTNNAVKVDYLFISNLHDMFLRCVWCTPKTIVLLGERIKNPRQLKAPELYFHPLCSILLNSSNKGLNFEISSNKQFRTVNYKSLQGCPIGSLEMTS